MSEDWFDEGGGPGNRVDSTALLDDASEHLWPIVDAGALVSLSLTRDGGALGVTITVDGRWRREYFRESEEIRDWLTAALEPIRLEVERTAASAAPGTRSRSRRGR